MYSIASTLKTITTLVAVILIISGCNWEVSCLHCEACTTITTRLVANDSLVYDTTLCTSSMLSQPFQDSVTRLIAGQQSPFVRVDRHDTTFNCQNASVKSKEARELEAKGWYCAYHK